MAEHQYAPKQFVYKSLGLAARWELDQVPEYYYLNLLNCQERDEESLSSRYGTLLICRDPVGSGTSNHFFTSSIVSLAKLNYGAVAQRYASLADGTLWQRNSNTQGAYTQIYSGLSGKPLQSLITNCFETSQPYLFLYDAAASIKIASGSSTPQLTGIDPPNNTANTLPYAPLLILIDNFASGNSYTTSGFSVAWAYSLITTLNVGLGHSVTDFFYNIKLLPPAGFFAGTCNGMLSTVSLSSSISVTINTIVSSGLSGGLYTTLTVATAGAHGLTTGFEIGIYGSSNPLLNGYYAVTVLTATTFTVPYVSIVQLGGRGGTVVGGNAPGGTSTAVITSEFGPPYLTQLAAWGFDQPTTGVTSFPIGNWSGTVAASSTASVGVTVALNLSQSSQANDFDLVVVTINVGTPANVSNIRLQFDVNGSGYTSAYYYKDIAPSFFQQNVSSTETAYTATQNQILAEQLGVIGPAIPSSPISASTTGTGSGTGPNRIASVGTATDQLQPGNFSTGKNAWTTVYIPRGSFVPVGQAGQADLDWSNISGWQVVFTTNSGGTSTVALNGIYFQWGYGPSSFGGVGYDYRYTYYNINTGTESNGSPVQEFGGAQYGYLPSQGAPIYLRQAVQVTGLYSADPQVTHIRIYRRGGTLADNWRRVDTVPNLTGTSTFIYKDVVPDAQLFEVDTLALDNDPPVTGTLKVPIQTTLAAATTGPGTSGGLVYYDTFTTQTVTTADPSTFVVGQLVEVGYAANLEIVRVIVGGTGSFTTILRLPHNQGEPVAAFSAPRVKCSLCALSSQGGVTQVWLAGDPANPHYLYFSKPGRPESFSPAAYIPVSSPDDTIVAVINWRGTIVVGTLKSWFVIIGGAQPYPQPTGSQHGIVASQGWTVVEGAIFYLAQDGIREFSGADGTYMTLPVEWLFRNNSTGPVPLLDLTQVSSAVMAYFQNEVYLSYVSQSGGGQRYRLIWNRLYRRFRVDDIAATAMLWEKDTNQLVDGKGVGGGQYATVLDQQYNLDYDDGGWSGGVLVKTPINLTMQTPYRQLGLPHFPKQWNMLEGDYNTQGQVITTTLLFKGEQDFTLTLANQNTGTARSKVQYQITQGGQPAATGVEAYSMSILHTMAVTVAPILYQENIYAVVLADFRTSYDTYVQKFGTDLLKLIKDGYFDYTATAQLVVSLYADDRTTPYYVDSTTLIPQTSRAVVRVIFAPRKCRLWRMTVTSSAPFQLWAPVAVESKPLQEGSGYQQYEFPVFQEVAANQ